MLIEADLEGTEMFGLGNGHFLILNAGIQNNTDKIVKVYISATRNLYLKNL